MFENTKKCDVQSRQYLLFQENTIPRTFIFSYLASTNLKSQNLKQFFQSHRCPSPMVL